MGRRWTKQTRSAAATIVGIDVGSVAVRVVVASVEQATDVTRDARPIRVLGLSEVPTDGVRRGMVTDPERLGGSIRAAVQAAEAEAQHRIVGAYLSAPLSMSAARPSAGARIMLDDADAIQASVRHPLAPDDMWATVAAAAGIELLGIVPGPLAAMAAVVLPHEQASGVVLVECGAEHTSAAVFCDGRVQRLGTVPVGGDHITRDLATLLKVRPDEAERLKVEIGQRHATREMEIMARGQDGTRKMVPVSLVVGIITARIDDTLVRLGEIIREKNSMYSENSVTNPKSVVLCGGGAALSGIGHSARAALAMPVRIAGPYDVRGPVLAQTPAYAAALGVVRWWDIAQTAQDRPLLRTYRGEDARQERNSPIQMGQNRWHTWLREFLP